MQSTFQSVQFIRTRQYDRSKSFHLKTFGVADLHREAVPSTQQCFVVTIKRSVVLTKKTCFFSYIFEKFERARCIFSRDGQTFRQ